VAVRLSRASRSFCGGSGSLCASIRRVLCLRGISRHYCAWGRESMGSCRESTVRQKQRACAQTLGVTSQQEYSHGGCKLATYPEARHPGFARLTQGIRWKCRCRRNSTVKRLGHALEITRFQYLGVLAILLGPLPYGERFIYGMTPAI
jgi:hypothetical protein